MLRQIFIASLMCLVAAGPAWCGCLQSVVVGEEAFSAAAEPAPIAHCETERAGQAVSDTACTHCGDASMGEQPLTLVKQEPPKPWPGAALVATLPAWLDSPPTGPPPGRTGPALPRLDPSTLVNLRVLLLI